MIPSPWVAAVLALAAYRVTRLAGWDDFPPILWVRNKALGIEVVAQSAMLNDSLRLTDTQPPTPQWRYKRLLLAQLVHCPFCLGWWVALAFYLGWRFAATGTLYVAAPFALAGAVGLLAKNLDP